MLVLSRRFGESITIQTPQGDVLIRIEPGNSENQHKLCIQAPEEITVLRAEVFERSQGVIK